MSKSVGTPKRLTVKGVAIAMAIVSAGYAYKTYFNGPATSFMGPAAAEGELDTSRLPRVAGATETYASAPTTIFISPDSVTKTAETTLAALKAEGWHPYEKPFTSKADSPEIKLMSLKKGPLGLNVFISLAPAQGNKTSVSYTAIAFATNLPFPADATDIEFDPDRPYLLCTTGGAVDATMAFLQNGLVADGWSPWSAKEEAKKPEGATQVTDNGLFSYFVRDGHQPVIALVQRRKDGRTYAKIEIVPEILLTPSKQKKEVSEAPAPATSEPNPAAQKMNDAFDQLAGEILNEARKATSEAIAGINKKPEPQPSGAQQSNETLNALADNTAPIPLPETAVNVEFDGAGSLDFKSASGVRAVAAFYRKAMKPLGWNEKPTVIDQDNMIALTFSKGEQDISITVMQLGKSVDVSANGSGLVTAAAESEAVSSEPSNSSDTPATAQVAEKDLQVQELAGLPVPTSNSLNGSEKSLYRVQVNARVPASVEAVLAFYRRELGKREGWKEAQGAIVEPKHAVVTYATSEGPAVLTLNHENGETVISLLVRKQVEATKSGMLPKPGSVKLLFGNVLDGEVSITIDKKTVKIAAGLGGKKPDGPMLEIPPGKHKFSFKLPGKGAETDEVEVAAGDIWGLLVGPGGVLALQMY